MILELIQGHNITPKKVSGTKGGEYHSPCPGCGGRDRFHAWPRQNNGEGSWWCRGCDQGGDCIDFLQQFENMAFKEAAERMGREIQGPVKRAVRTPRPKPAAANSRPPEAVEVREQSGLWLEKATAFVEWAHEKLLENEEQMAWLLARGITRQTVNRFRLGWNPGKSGRDLFRPRESWGLPELLKDDGKPKKLWIPRGLVIPKFDDSGRLQRVRIRRPEGEPKYFVLPGSASEPVPMLYIPGFWPGRHQALVVCEAELDGMLIAQEAGDLVSVLAPGSSQAKPRDAVSARACREAAWIGVALDSGDPDGAGDKGTTWWLEAYRQAEDIRPAGVKDPGELVKAGKPVRDWMLASLPSVWRRAAEEKPTASNDVAKPEQAADREHESASSTDHGNRGESPRATKKLQELKHALDASQVWVIMVIRPDEARIYGLRWVGKRWVRDKKWVYTDAGKIIHNLFWFDDEVERYLSRHPDRDKGIHCRNFWNGLEDC